MLNRYQRDPLKLQRLLWPKVYFYAKQREIIQSYVDNFRTVVPAGNKLGKDFVSGFIALHCFLCYEEVRVVTTSVKDKHLDVLWGEIGRFIQTATLPDDREKTGVLDVKNGGPLIINHRGIRKVVGGKRCEISYLVGTVSEKGEGLAGHHAKMTLLLVDEASGVDDEVLIQGNKWAKRQVIIGNPRPCDNFFKKAVKQGDILPADYTGASGGFTERPAWLEAALAGNNSN